MSVYAAFVMTYCRPEILERTLKTFIFQSCPPHRILIVDNDPLQSAKAVVDAFEGLNVGYYAVGYNSGPAGAAYHGCKILFEEGWEWVLWIDDDDQPVLNDTIERIINIATKYPFPSEIGILGAVGVRFNAKNAKVLRLSDDEPNQFIEVDNIAGNQFPLIHRRVFDSGVFPDPKLFFGFEELEFNLRVKKASYKLLIDKTLLSDLRTFWNRNSTTQSGYQKKSKKLLWREYYSTRNMIYVLKEISGTKLGLYRFCTRSIFKAFYGFRYGLEYGKNNFQFIFKGVYHGMQNRMGKL